MHEYEDECYVQDLWDAACIGDSPGNGREGQEEGKEVSEGWVGAVVGFCCLFLLQLTSGCIRMVWGMYVVIYLSEDFLGRYY